MASSSRFPEVEEEKITEIIDAAIPETQKELCKYRAIEMRGVLKFIVKGKRYNSALKFWRPQLHPRRR